jgi:hypothetical protein
VNKLILAVVPSCIAFGPMFMVIAGAGRASGDPVFAHIVMDCGAVMLALGLVAMFRIITKQQSLIEKLQADQQSSGGG